MKKLVIESLDPDRNTAQNQVEQACTQAKCILCLSKIEDLSRIIQLSLELLCNWRVVTAKPSTAVLEIARSLKPDVILLDTRIDDGAELELLRSLCASSAVSSIPILLLVETTRQPQSTYANFGVVAAIAKPFDIFDLAHKINDCLNWDQLEL